MDVKLRFEITIYFNRQKTEGDRLQFRSMSSSSATRFHLVLYYYSIVISSTTINLVNSNRVINTSKLAISVPSDISGDPFLSTDAYYELAKLVKTEYTDNSPYPHIFFDGLLPSNIVAACNSEIPHKNIEDLPLELLLDRDQNGKTNYRNEDSIGPACMSLIAHSRSSKFIKFLEEMTGIDNLIYDPHMFGGGIHQSVRSGVLRVHTDFNLHIHHLQKGNHLWRRVNVFFYLNDDWKEEYNGHLELWSSDMKTKVKSYLPIANRVVILSSSRISFHGHPDPLNCPSNRTRNSIAIYYYSNTPHPLDSEKHGFINTIFKLRPEDIPTLVNEEF